MISKDTNLRKKFFRLRKKVNVISACNKFLLGQKNLKRNCKIKILTHQILFWTKMFPNGAFFRYAMRVRVLYSIIFKLWIVPSDNNKWFHQRSYLIWDRWEQPKSFCKHELSKREDEKKVIIQLEIDEIGKKVIKCWEYLLSHHH